MECFTRRDLLNSGMAAVAGGLTAAVVSEAASHTGEADAKREPGRGSFSTGR
jgi:hypothetical protein